MMRMTFSLMLLRRVSTSGVTTFHLLDAARTADVRAPHDRTVRHREHEFPQRNQGGNLGRTC